MDRGAKWLVMVQVGLLGDFTFLSFLHWYLNVMTPISALQWWMNNSCDHIRRCNRNSAASRWPTSREVFCICWMCCQPLPKVSLSIESPQPESLLPWCTHVMYQAGWGVQQFGPKTEVCPLMGCIQFKTLPSFSLYPNAPFHRDGFTRPPLDVSKEQNLCLTVMASWRI